MKNILIIGEKSFMSKNFIDDFDSRFNFFSIRKYFKKKSEKNFLRILDKNIKKIRLI